MKLKIIIAILLIGVVAGCVDNAPEEKHSDFTIIDDGNNNTQNIKVVHDDKRNMTCYTNWEMTHGGISCHKDSDLYS